MRTEPALRTVNGLVSAAGVATGAGFIVTKTGTGSYIIRFTPPFRASPSVSATLVGVTAGQTAQAQLAADNTGIVTSSANGTIVDAQFAFTAVGLPR